ncbi:MAG: xanthine dehydrogenase family protein subunit M, partial [Chloroflexota bacterium]
VPFRPLTAETILAENSIDENTIAAAAKAAMDDVTPISDTRGSARYRKMMVRNLTLQAVRDVWEQIGG